MYLYSNIVGTFVFSQNFQIREKILFNEKQLLEFAGKLSAGEVIETEKPFLEKFKNIEDLRQGKNQKALDAIAKELLGYTQKMYENNLLVTKASVSLSVTDDLLIIQVSSSVDELAKSINLLSKRLREWFSYSLPEVEDRITDHKKFAEICLSDRKQLVQEFHVQHGMGRDLQKKDSIAIQNLARTILELFRQKEEAERYLEDLMARVCPNMTAVAGALIGAKLITIGGSLRNLVVMPSSTIQLLGAEKALFKHMLNKKNVRPPKHGEIINHPLVSSAPREERGRRARALADKILLAVKVDYFKGQFIGDRLRKELEAKFA
ncbi:MAG: hypothetical protein HGA85_05170 [Nanoarchaeota archaeon]|nr:hypothetical protein [Nanoarchaeota archaeon]